MGDNRFIVVGDKIKNWIKPRIINENKTAQAVPEGHPDVFPDFDTNGSLVEILPEFLDYFSRPGRVFEVFHRESRDVREVFRVLLMHHPCIMVLCINFSLTA